MSFVRTLKISWKKLCKKFWEVESSVWVCHSYWRAALIGNRTIVFLTERERERDSWRYSASYVCMCLRVSKSQENTKTRAIFPLFLRRLGILGPPWLNIGVSPMTGDVCEVYCIHNGTHKTFYIQTEAIVIISTLCLTALPTIKQLLFSIVR